MMNAPAIQRTLGPIPFACALALVVFCTGCSSPVARDAPTAAPSPAIAAARTMEQQRAATNALANRGAADLERGIKSYEDGAYKSAAKQFQAALDLGLDKADQAIAHKYLAFMTCVSGREKSCREEFRKALDADPAFELTAAEVGHPVWGTVFRSVKADAAVKVRAK